MAAGAAHRMNRGAVKTKKGLTASWAFQVFLNHMHSLLFTKLQIHLQVLLFFCDNIPESEGLLYME